MEKAALVHILREIALLMELKGENPFKVRAYLQAATLLEQDAAIWQLLESQGDITTIRGIGKALAEKIETLYSTGHLPYYEELKSCVPVELLDMVNVPGLGPKKVKQLFDELGIKTIKALKKACLDGQVAKLKGFGQKTEEKILAGLEKRAQYQKRYLWWDAQVIAQKILKSIEALPEVEKASSAGSLRRKVETVGDLDFIVASKDPKSVMASFISEQWVHEVIERGLTKSSIRLESGLKADLRVVPLDVYYFALHHFTGSKEHNVLMRQRAHALGYSLSEWGLKLKDTQKPVACQIASEEDLFKLLNLHYIPPELREGLDEISHAEKKKCPILIKQEDIRGVFHNHTDASDGMACLEEMVAGAQALGFQYIGIADHSKASVQANGLDEKRILQQIKAIDKLNASGKYKIHIFKGVEADILTDGSLDLDEAILSQLDYVVGSVHRGFAMDEATMTRRIIRAIESPYLSMLGHITGRLLLKREPYAVNVQKVIESAVKCDKIIEINAHPRRLDMDWRYWKQASEQGLVASINPDAHDVEGLKYYKAGVNVARKGWLTKKSVLNAWPLAKVKQYLKNIRQF